MKNKIKIVIFLGIIILIAGIFVIFIKPGKLISESQEETINLWGEPPQFSVTYLPQQDNKLARFEIWYYPEQNKKISFLSGKIIDSQDWQTNQQVPQSPYKPWDFDIYISYSKLIDLIGEENLNLIDLPGFSDEGIQTYAAKDLVLILEDDYLTYVQTLAFDENIQTESLAEEPDLKTYSSSDIGFSIQYPKEWYLQNGVYSNYDIEYVLKEEDLPEKIFKCDFYQYYESIKLKELEEVQKGDITINKTSLVEKGGDAEDLGYGDNVAFIFEKEDTEPIILVCFYYEKEFEENLINSLKTFEFIQ